MSSDRKLSYAVSTDPSFRVFAAIAREVERCGHDLALPEERFEFWSKLLWTRFPPQNFPLPYHELESLANALAAPKYAAAMQLFALGTLGLSELGVEHRIHHELFRTLRARKLRILANNMAKSARLPHFRPIKVAKGQQTEAAVGSWGNVRVGPAPSALDCEVIAAESAPARARAPRRPARS
ncbi:hypothetical protein ACFL6C_02505 [Myxococcota bacterium]